MVRGAFCQVSLLLWICTVSTNRTIWGYIVTTIRKERDEANVFTAIGKERDEANMFTTIRKERDEANVFTTIRKYR